MALPQKEYQRAFEHDLVMQQQTESLMKQEPGSADVMMEMSRTYERLGDVSLRSGELPLAIEL